ncbi:MAG: lactate racemase domain-containing protein [Candidatus Bathyarchaeota archaeon]|nr:lactate racemase domain-containing protein [Candidatus Bathyarchaeota archaeon]
MLNIAVPVNEFLGDNRIPISFPKGWEVQEYPVGNRSPPLAQKQMRESFPQPVGTRTIGHLAKGKTGKIVITVDDLTRPTPVEQILPYVARELNEAGISDDQIIILSAIGAHLPMKVEDFERKVGAAMLLRFDCINHSVYEDFIDLGETSMGTHLMVNKDFVEADLRISICGVKKHPTAGASGGGKVVIPGVCSLETTKWNHTVVRALADNGPWNIRGNVERMDMQEAARIAGLDVQVNCVYNGLREIVGLYVGDVDEAWHEAVRHCYGVHALPPSNKKADIVVVNSYPMSAFGVDWSVASDSLSEGGSAVGIHLNSALGFGWYGDSKAFVTKQWRRWNILHRSTVRPWPVKQADNIMVFDPKPTKSAKLRYSEKVEWVDKWSEVIERLRMIHGEKASVAVYPSCLGFNPSKRQLKL